MSYGGDEHELQPDVPEVLQAEPDEAPLSAVPVCVDEVRAPVRVQPLPRKAGSTRTRNVSASAAWRALTADHRRAVARVVSGSAFRFAFSEASTQDDAAMAWWPANVPLVVECATELWLKADTAAADISVTTEMWAAGA